MENILNPLPTFLWFKMNFNQAISEKPNWIFKVAKISKRRQVILVEHNRNQESRFSIGFEHPHNYYIEKYKTV